MEKMRKLTCFLHTPQPHIDANSVVLPYLWYANQLQVLRHGGILDAYCLPVDDGYLYCGEAYWTQMMCTDAEWMPVVRKWATEQLNVNERTDDESK